MHAIDSRDPSRGPLFSLPITVIIPHAVGPAAAIGVATSDAEAADTPPPLSFPLTLRGGKPIRRFISVPESAEWATVKLSTGNVESCLVTSSHV